MVLVEDEIVRTPGHKQTLASTPTIIGEEDWRNVGVVSMEGVESDTAKYIPDQDNTILQPSLHIRHSK